MLPRMSDELWQKVQAVYRERGYLVIWCSVPRNVGDSVTAVFSTEELPLLESLPQPFAVVGVTDISDLKTQSDMLGLEWGPHHDADVNDYFYRCVTD